MKRDRGLLDEDDDDDAMVIDDDEPSAKRARALVGEELREALFPPSFPWDTLAPELKLMILGDPTFGLVDLAHIMAVNQDFHNLVDGEQLLPTFLAKYVVKPMKDRLDQRLINPVRVMDYRYAMQRLYSMYMFYLRYLHEMTTGKAFGTFARGLSQQMAKLVSEALGTSRSDTMLHIHVRPIDLVINHDPVERYDEWYTKPRQRFVMTGLPEVDRAVARILAYRGMAQEHRFLEQAFYTLLLYYPTELRVTATTYGLGTWNAGYWYPQDDDTTREMLTGDNFLPGDDLYEGNGDEAHASPAELINDLRNGDWQAVDGMVFNGDPEVIARSTHVFEQAVYDQYVPTLTDWITRHPL